MKTTLMTIIGILGYIHRVRAGDNLKLIDYTNMKEEFPEFIGEFCSNISGYE